MTSLPYASQILSTKVGLIPVIYKDKRPDHRLLPLDDTGKPTWEPFKTTLPSPEDLNRWFRTPHNYGVVAGWQGLMVLDFDDATEHSRWQFWATQQGGIAKFAAQNAFQVTTSRGVLRGSARVHKERGMAGKEYQAKETLRTLRQAQGRLGRPERFLSRDR